jgi:hypothetical protein
MKGSGFLTKPTQQVWRDAGSPPRRDDCLLKERQASSHRARRARLWLVLSAAGSACSQVLLTLFRHHLAPFVVSRQAALQCLRALN